MELLFFYDMMPCQMTTDNTWLIGLISDTHGYLQSEVLKIFARTDLIVHAGDIGNSKILDALETVAPVHAVRGNMDFGNWASALPLFEVITFGGIMLYVLHDLQKLDLDPDASGISAVISGHTHRPLIKNNNGILYLNPGSASQPRYNHSASVMMIKVTEAGIKAELIGLTK
jgi:putative phosphoesterase